MPQINRLGLNDLLGVMDAGSNKRNSKKSIKSQSTVDEAFNLVDLYRVCLFYIWLSNRLIPDVKR